MAVTRKTGSAESIHEMRVALARIRLWLKLAGHHALRDDARWLRSAAAPIRDLDVLQSLHRRSKVSRLRERRRAEWRRLGEGLDSPRAGALLDALAVLPPAPMHTVQRNTRRVIARCVALRRPGQRWTNDVASLHRLRCAVRSVRYALETTGQPASHLVPLQDSLGEACDFAIALREARGKARLRRALLRKQALASKRAQKQWNVLRRRLEALL
jgi:CHAD domain-containing protein